MHSRPAQPSDIPALKQLSESIGQPDYDFTGGVEHIEIVFDADDKPVMFLVARRAVYLDMFADSSLTPHQKMHGMRLCEEKLPILAEKGYTEVMAFTEPSISERFGRRLQRSFGWVRSRPCWCKRL